LRQESKISIATLYTRVPFRKEGFYRITNIYYATCRKVEKEKDSLDFLHRMGKETTYGLLDVKIDPRMTIGKMSPERLKRKEFIGVRGVEKLDSEVFLKKLTETVKTSPHKSLLVLVFGYKDNFEATVTKAAYFSYLLDINTPVLLFDWPGDQAVSVSGYKKAQSLARDSGPYLGEFLATVIRRVRPENLWVHSSSLGCQVACNAFEYMYKHSDLADADTEIAQVLLAAPDVGQDEFDHQFKKEITALTGNLTTYVASDDEALLMSGLLNRQKRLGRQKVKEHAQFEEAKDILYLKSLKPDKFDLVDVTPIDKASYKHGYYLENPEYFDDVYLRFIGKRPHANRRLFLIKYKDETDYWVLRGRK
jgi:esterase/lipase superfamily enzyme